MDEIKDKMKGLMKRVNTNFSSSSGKFQGQGRVLGSGSSSNSSSDGRSNIAYQQQQQLRREQQQKQQRNISNPANQKPQIQKQEPANQTAQIQGQEAQNCRQPEKATDDYVHKSETQNSGFNPYSPYMASTVGPKSGTSLNMFECPVCSNWFNTEQEINSHIEWCLQNNSGTNTSEPNQGIVSLEHNQEEGELREDLRRVAGVFLSGKPSAETLEVVLKLFRNVASDPANGKFRRIRMSNPKIQSTVGSAVGGIEFLEKVGFKIQEEDGDLWGCMDELSEEALTNIIYAISLLERHVPDSSSSSASNPTPDVQPSKAVSPKKIDRQVRVFFAASENMAAKINLPDSFYELSAAELKREADSRKKKLEDSQLLIPKSFREKQANAARKKYKATVIRILFPDGIILQGVFLPNESTTALYEFVASSLKEQCLQFELVHPTFKKSRIIPHLMGESGSISSLEDEDLVPAALVKFLPHETDNIVFTGLSNDLLSKSEPLTADAFPSERKPLPSAN